jgi:hypothetical protein
MQADKIVHVFQKEKGRSVHYPVFGDLRELDAIVKFPRFPKMQRDGAIRIGSKRRERYAAAVIPLILGKGISSTTPRRMLHRESPPPWILSGSAPPE